MSTHKAKLEDGRIFVGETGFRVPRGGCPGPAAVRASDGRVLASAFEARMGSSEHCWHLASVSTYGLVDGEISRKTETRCCCYCGKGRTVQFEFVPPPGHGPLAPPNHYAVVSDTEEP